MIRNTWMSGEGLVPSFIYRRYWQRRTQRRELKSGPFTNMINERIDAVIAKFPEVVCR